MMLQGGNAALAWRSAMWQSSQVSGRPARREHGKGHTPTGREEGHGNGKGMEGWTEAITIQKAIVGASDDNMRFLLLLDGFCNTNQKLNLVNIATILHRGGKMRLDLPKHVLIFLADALKSNNAGRFEGQDAHASDGDWRSAYVLVVRPALRKGQVQWQLGPSAREL